MKRKYSQRKYLPVYMGIVFLIIYILLAIYFTKKQHIECNIKLQNCVYECMAAGNLQLNCDNWCHVK